MIVRSEDDLAPIVRSEDDIVLFSDDLAKIVRQTDDLYGGPLCTHTFAAQSVFGTADRGAITRAVMQNYTGAGQTISVNGGMYFAA